MITALRSRLSLSAQASIDVSRSLAATNYETHLLGWGVAETGA